MTRESEKEGIVFYTVSFALPKSGLYFYHFEILKKDGSFRLFRLGLSDTNMEEGKAWQITCCPKDYAVPASCRGKIMYQIFPDRFAIGGKRLIEGKDTPFYLHASPDEPPLRGPAGDGRWNTDFYGGNFLGITERLDELKSLGVSLIYLNPIFKSPSNHRYDTSDYLKPDPMLGTEEDFAHLCSEAAKRGIRIILDGVFSH
ncbi:MAG: glycoside hydrolase family 13 protein, partial [Clostridia bacterium]|nr:glycoside hydrolase family 13 protein [Clostridia bacterium]